MKLPNSMVMRIMEDPAAEKEADRLSQGVTSRTPGEIMREMGSRLGADFSGVQFHSDTLSMDRSRAMGARAWAQGSDVHFGKGGFDPKIAAHELVHTVQQGAVEGNVSRSVPNGTVQLFRNEDENAIQRRQNIPANATSLELMNAQKLSSDYGRQIFTDLKKPIKKFAQQNGSRVSDLNEDTGILYLSRLGDRDYSGEEILKDIATRSVINKDEMWDRTDEYEGFLDYMKNRTDRVGLESVALQTNILVGNPRYDHQNDQHVKKRAYEMTSAELAGPGGFNPTGDAEVLEAQKKIDNANSAKEAYYAFLSYTEGRDFTRQEIDDSFQYVNNARQPVPYIIDDQNQRVDLTEAQTNQRLQENKNIVNEHKFAKKEAQDLHDMLKKLAPGPVKDRMQERYDAAVVRYNNARARKNQIKKIQYDHKTRADVNVPLLKIKLKNMVRQVRDYPELKHRIGGLNIKWNEKKGAYREDVSKEVMAATTSANWRNEKVELTYDAYIDRDTPEGQRIRDIANTGPDSIGNKLHNVGNHELGHAQSSFLNETEGEHDRRQAESDILDATLQKVIPNEYPNLPRVAEDGNKKYQGQIDTENSDVLTNLKLTSEYGQSSPVEWFAEAFHDVYSKGADAKPASIVMVKEYEKRMAAKQKAGFQKKQRGWVSNLFTKIGRFFKRWSNYGARHGAPQQAPAVPQPQAVVNQNQGAPQQQPENDNQDDVPLQLPGNGNQDDNILQLPEIGNQDNNILQQPQNDNQDDVPLQLPQNNIINNDPLQHYAENILEKDLIAVRGRKRLHGKKKKKGK
ncbi:MAG: DUF4157 domain-containing protein [Anaerolineaceae bacterium]|nr:DUF4157 domain-containing protein [Anaerolineaceae bacterium]